VREPRVGSLTGVGGRNGGWGTDGNWRRWRPRENDGLRVLVGDGPTGSALQAGGQCGLGRDDDGVDLPTVEDLLPRALELISVGEIVEELCAVEVGAAIDEYRGGRIKFPDQIAAPIVVIENWTLRRMGLQKGNGAGRELVGLGLRLVVDYLENADAGECSHKKDDGGVEPGAKRGRGTYWRVNGWARAAELPSE